MKSSTKDLIATIGTAIIVGLLWLGLSAITSGCAPATVAESQIEPGPHDWRCQLIDIERKDGHVVARVYRCQER